MKQFIAHKCAITRASPNEKGQQVILGQRVVERGVGVGDGVSTATQFKVC